MKKILVLYYSQSGQLFEIVNSFLSPLFHRTEYRIFFQKLAPIPPYPFPWTVSGFYDQMPESVLMESPSIEPVSFDPDDSFDLIFLAYTVWFLSPSPPIAAFLQSPEARVMKNTPVITIVNCRDKWLMAQERVKEMVIRNGGKLIDHVAFVFSGGALITMITTAIWLFSGEKKVCRFLPPAGVHNRDIAGARRFGLAIDSALKNNQIDGIHSVLHGLGAVTVTAPMIHLEKKGFRLLSVWAERIRKTGMQGDKNRNLPLLFFRINLLLLIIISFPLSMIYRVAAHSILRDEFEKDIRYFELPSGSSTDRMDKY
ncbi:MAG: hypothetical protein WA151_08190 [Desulfatirhabdiaceae bacterium]